MPVRLTLLKLWLEAWLCLLGWPQAGHSQYHSPPELVIPLKVTGSSRGERASGWLSYSLHFGGQRHIIHMKAKQLLVSRDLPVFTYTDQGALLEDHPFVPTNCYYHGFVEGDPESLISFSTCLGGLQGMLHVKAITYEIKPKRFSTIFEHLVYKMDSEEKQFPPMSCALTDEEIARQLKLQESNNSVLMQGAFESWWTHRRVIELVLVVDYEQYIFKNRNHSLIQNELFDIVNGLDEIYSQIDADIFLSGYEIWNERNHINMSNDITPVLIQFCIWKKDNLQKRMHHDIGHLFTNRNFSYNLGLAYISSFCHHRLNCGVDNVIGNTLTEIAYIVSHELGHNLGFAHDGAFCTCGEPTCVMFEEKSYATKFSNCSYNFMWGRAARNPCFLNFPRRAEAMGHRCGNAVVEEGEQCDCGSLQRCTSDPCCSLHCTLNAGATCAFGLCCKDCQLMPSGAECRKPIGECDLPEWCNGTSNECAADVYLQDGTSCSYGGYCYAGRCNHRNLRCEEIFGKGVPSAHQLCYRDINTRGDRFGNCGIRGDTYIRCNASDTFCGRIQCKNVTAIPILKDHTTLHSTTIAGFSCWTSEYHIGIKIPDIGTVTDGTPCGSNLWCKNRKCVPTSFANKTCTPATCNNKGVCNNKNHCHCQREWAPPFCKFPGLGGSVDSGPPQQKTEPITPAPPRKKLREKSIFFIYIPLRLLLLCLFISIGNTTNRNEAGKRRAPAAPEAGERSAPATSESGERSAPAAPEAGEHSAPATPEAGEPTPETAP